MVEPRTVTNALDFPWLAVTTLTGERQRVSLLDLFRDAHLLADLAPVLTPVERDAYLRFLPTVAALVLREIRDDEEREDVASAGQFPAEALTAFSQRWAHLFDVAATVHPFLQRHDVTRTDLDALVTPKKPLVNPARPNNAVLTDLVGLHPHVPGGSSSRWAIRRDPRDPNTDLGVLTGLLVTAWWQTRRSNAKGHDRRTLENGNPGQVGPRPMSIFWIGTNLGLTIMANTPTDWTDPDSAELPMWADQTRRPSPAWLATNPTSLWRTTFARNIPFIYWDDTTNPLGYVIGPTTYPVPALAEEPKQSLAAMHDADYARLYADVTKRGQPTERKQVTALGARLSSTEGYTRWYRNRINQALRPWGRQDRFSVPSHGHEWRYGVYSEVCHVTGSREWADWSVLPRDVLAPTDEHALAVTNLLSVVETIRSRMYSTIRLACEGRQGKQSQDPALLETAQTQFYAAVEEPLVGYVAALVAGTQVEARTVAEQIRHLGITTFGNVTQCLLTPETVAQVSMARQAFEWESHLAVTKIYGPATAQESM